MIDEYVEVFIDEFGEATSHQEVPQSSIEKWKGRLPDRLLSYWQELGWSGYADGLFWLVNPDDYEAVLDEWLQDTLLQGADKFHVIARTAFGNLYVWGERSGFSVRILSIPHAIVSLKGDVERTIDDPDLYLSSFLTGRTVKDAQVKDDGGKELFSRALKKLGALTADEMYGFEPAIIAGGNMQLKNLKKVDIQTHLMILRQLGGPPSLPFAKLNIPEN